MFRYPVWKERRTRSLAKATVWRVIGILFLALVTYIFTKQWVTMALITLCHHAAFILLYYLHDRFWNWTGWLRYSRAKPIVRIILYETLMGNLVLGLISFAFTGEWQVATMITLVYILNKHWMYFVHDFLWGKLRPVIVYSYVVCDLIHRGHLRALQQAKALGNYLIVGVLTDEATMAYKRRPVNSFEERAEMVANLKCVDRVMKQESLDPTENLKKLNADILTHSHEEGEDFPGADYMASVGKKAIRTEYYHGQSTTDIINRILSRRE